MQSVAELRETLEDLTARVLASGADDPRAGVAILDELSAVVDAMEGPAAAPAAQALARLGTGGAAEACSLDALAAALAATSNYLADGAAPDYPALVQAWEALAPSPAADRATLPPAPEAPPAAAEADVPQASPSLASDAELVREFACEAGDLITAAEAAILVLESQSDHAESINTVLRAFHTIKGVSGFLEIEPVHVLAHQAEEMLIRAREGQLRMDASHIELALRSCDALRGMIQSAAQGGAGAALPVPQGYPQLLAALAACVPGDGEQAGAVGLPPADDAESFRKPSPQAPAAPQGDATRDGATAAADYSGDDSVRVNSARLDELVNLIGELVIAQSRIARDAACASGETGEPAGSVAAAGKVVRQLQDLAMGLRMVPLKRTFQKVARLVRDLSHRGGKAVEFVTAGEETEIDRKMVEALNDPLVHLIRNALDHGLEPAAERIAAGKSPQGRLRLSAYHAAGSVVIELEDDGRGLDREKVLREATRRGLVEPGRRLAPEEIDRLVFHPGLSTAAEVTELSGRGVGLDVVHRAIESLRGHIELATQRGGGTRFTLRLPLTTAILDAMLLGASGERFFLPTAVIARSFRIDPAEVFRVAGRGELVRHQDQVLSLARLDGLLGLDAAPAARPMAVVVESGGRRCALAVDELLGQQQIVIKSLGSGLPPVPAVAGATILSDGRVALILDGLQLVALALGGPQRAGESFPEPLSSGSSPRSQP